MRFLLTLTTFVFLTLMSPFIYGQTGSSEPGFGGFDLESNQTLSPEEIAQQQKEAEEAAEQACAVCGSSVALIAGLSLVGLILNIAILVWVARDAKNRSMDGAILWMILVMFLGLLGLIIYILSRPQGALGQCGTCQGKRLTTSARCPHCQNP